MSKWKIWTRFQIQKYKRLTNTASLSYGTSLSFQLFHQRPDFILILPKLSLILGYLCVKLRESLIFKLIQPLTLLLLNLSPSLTICSLSGAVLRCPLVDGLFDNPLTTGLLARREHNLLREGTQRCG